MYLPTLRALFSLNTRDSAAAIQALQTASRYDLALGGVGFTARFGGPYPIYVRGVAYLAARQPAEAAAEFQRILDHRSILLVDPMGASARVQLPRALAFAGNVVKAKSAYDDLFTLWKNADPDLPVLKHARNTLGCGDPQIPRVVDRLGMCGATPRGDFTMSRESVVESRISGHTVYPGTCFTVAVGTELCLLR
jgi:hypothetical protein